MRTITTEEHDALSELRAKLIKKERLGYWLDTIFTGLIYAFCASVATWAFLGLYITWR